MIGKAKLWPLITTARPAAKFAARPEAKFAASPVTKFAAKPVAWTTVWTETWPALLIAVWIAVWITAWPAAWSAEGILPAIPGMEISIGPLTAAADEADPSKSDQAKNEIYEPEWEDVSVVIPGLEQEYTLLWISDMHICTGGNDPDVSEDHSAEVQERRETFQSASGRMAEDTWSLLSDQIDSMGADYVIFGADMADYASETNLSVLQTGMEKLQTPWMYIRADHDYARWYGNMDIERMRELQRKIAPQNKIWAERFDGFTLVGLDNTTSAISDKTLEKFKAIYAEGTPIILCTHVPFDTGSPDSEKLADISKEYWDDRVLCWGEGDYCDTSKSPAMKEMLDMITAPGSPVCAVFAGHLHTSWDGNLTDTCTGHVFSAAFEDHVGRITVSG